MNVPSRRRFCGAFGLVVAGALGLGVAAAANASGAYPAQPIRLVVPFTPGGGGDVLARLLADRLGRAKGWSVVVENKPGGSTVIANESVVRAAPDGYTVLLNVPLLVQTAAMLRKLPYDPLTDLTPVVDLVTSPLWFAVGTGRVSATTMPAFVEQARARPADFPFGSIGMGSSAHLFGYRLNEAAGVSLTHVPYKGSSQAMQGLLSGEIAAVFLDFVTMRPQIEAGRIRALAVSGVARSPLTPDVPTLSELGYSGFEPHTWAGLFVPAKTPAPVVETLGSAVRSVLAEPEVIARFKELGYVPGGSSQAAFAAQVKADSERWGRLIRQAGVRLD